MVLSVIVFADDADAAGLVKRAISTAGKWLHSDLPLKTVFTNATNTYDAGKKQVFQSDGTNAGMKIITSSDPSGVVQGDIWFNTNDLKWQGLSVTQTAERTENKGAVSGYTPLNSNSLIPSRFLGSGTNSSSNFLRGDNTWSVVTSSGYTKINNLNSGTASIVGTNATLSDTQATFKSLTQVSGNTTITNGTKTLTFNLGNNVLMTTGSLQNVTQGLIVEGLSTDVVNATTTYTVTSTDDTIFVNPITRVKYTITLPSVSTVQGKVYNFIYTSQLGVPVKIDGSGSELIYKDQNLNMTTYRDIVRLQSTGERWIILDQGITQKTNSGTFLVVDEFLNYFVTSGSIGQQAWITSGTAPTVTTAGVIGHPGLIHHQPATNVKTTFSLGSQTAGTGWFVPTVYYEVQLIARMPVIATSELRFGLTESPIHPNGTHPYSSVVQNAIFDYNSTKSANWICNTKDASSFTRVVSSIPAVANEWVTLRIIHVNSTGTDFWVNDNIACTINTNAPSNDLTPVIGTVGRGGTVNMDFDMFRMWVPDMRTDFRR